MGRSIFIGLECRFKIGIRSIFHIGGHIAVGHIINNLLVGNFILQNYKKLFTRCHNRICMTRQIPLDIHIYQTGLRTFHCVIVQTFNVFNKVHIHICRFIIAHLCPSKPERNCQLLLFQFLLFVCYELLIFRSLQLCSQLIGSHIDSRFIFLK